MACLVFAGIAAMCAWWLGGESNIRISPEATKLRESDNSLPSQESGSVSASTEKPPPTQDDLLEAWAEGRFKRVRAKDARSNLDRYMMIDDEAFLTAKQDDALRKKLADFLVAYSSTDFKNYLRFRNPQTMADADNPQVRAKLNEFVKSWNSAWGPPPTDSVSLMEALWRLYIQGELKPLRGGPVIEFVNWRSCRTVVRRIAQNKIVLPEWGSSAGTESHFYKQFVTNGRQAISPSVLHLAIQNVASVESILDGDGEIIYADFEIIFRTGEDPPHPILLRFVWSSHDLDWLPLNAMQLWNNTLKPFIW